jgi:hypothetical protein
VLLDLVIQGGMTFELWNQSNDLCPFAGYELLPASQIFQLRWCAEILYSTLALVCPRCRLRLSSMGYAAILHTADVTLQSFVCATPRLCINVCVDNGNSLVCFSSWIWLLREA